MRKYGLDVANLILFITVANDDTNSVYQGQQPCGDKYQPRGGAGGTSERVRSEVSAAQEGVDQAVSTSKQNKNKRVVCWDYFLFY